MKNVYSDSPLAEFAAESFLYSSPASMASLFNTFLAYEHSFKNETWI